MVNGCGTGLRSPVRCFHFMAKKRHDKHHTNFAQGCVQKQKAAESILRGGRAACAVARSHTWHGVVQGKIFERIVLDTSNVLTCMSTYNDLHTWPANP